jgi:hypothetical protein
MWWVLSQVFLGFLSDAIVMMWLQQKLNIESATVE